MSAAAYFALFQQIDGLLFFDLYDKNDSKAYGAVATSFDHYYPESPRAKHLYNLALQSIKVIRSQRPMDLDKVEKKEVSFLDIELPDVHGENTKLSSVATGKVVLINFTAYMSEWSPALNMEFGDLYTRYHDKAWRFTRSLWIMMSTSGRTPLLIYLGLAYVIHSLFTLRPRRCIT